jgi:hypothetical protein
MEEENKENENQDKLDYEILFEDFSYFDLSFKLIVIGNSGKKLLLYNNQLKYISNNRCRKIMLIFPGNEAQIRADSFSNNRLRIFHL